MKPLTSLFSFLFFARGKMHFTIYEPNLFVLSSTASVSQSLLSCLEYFFMSVTMKNWEMAHTYQKKKSPCNYRTKLAKIYFPSPPPPHFFSKALTLIQTLNVHKRTQTISTAFVINYLQNHHFVTVTVRITAISITQP